MVEPIHHPSLPKGTKRRGHRRWYVFLTAIVLCLMTISTTRTNGITIRRIEIIIDHVGTNNSSFDTTGTAVTKSTTSTPVNLTYVDHRDASKTPTTFQTVASPLTAQQNHNLDLTGGCTCTEPTRWYAQAGQDKYIWDRVLKPQNLCCKGIYVEFGALDGLHMSNTFSLEKFQGWKGLLADVDERHRLGARENRTRANWIHGPICPRSETNVTILLSRLQGWTGSVNGYEPTRVGQGEYRKNFPCHYLADELKKRGWNRVDYMTIDTEGSELSLVLDFPWDDFDIRIVQIEQLDERKYEAQIGRKEKIIQRLESKGYKLLSVYTVAPYDTDDLILTRNVDEFLNMTLPDKSRDGDPTARPMSKHVVEISQVEDQLLKAIQDRPLERNNVMELRKQKAIEALKERARNREDSAKKGSQEAREESDGTR